MPNNVNLVLNPPFVQKEIHHSGMLIGQSGCIDAPSVDKLGDIPNQLILALWNSLAKLPCIHVGWQLGIWSQAFSSVTQFCFTAHQFKTQEDQEGPASFISDATQNLQK